MNFAKLNKKFSSQHENLITKYRIAKARALQERVCFSANGEIWELGPKLLRRKSSVPNIMELGYYPWKSKVVSELPERNIC